mgnify:CR=1 FL=1
MKLAKKSDIVIAYILLIILFIALLGLIYLKQNYNKETIDNIDNIDNVTNILSIDKIINDFNINTKIVNLKNEGITFNASKNDDNILLNYIKNNSNTSFEVNYTNGVLMLDVNNKDDYDIASLAFEVFFDNLCYFQGNSITDCDTTLSAINNNLLTDSALKISNLGNDSYFLTLDTNKQIEIYINNIISYNEETIVAIDDYDYNLTINNYMLSNFNIDYDQENNTLEFNYTLSKLSDNDKNIELILTIYDKDRQILDNNSTQVIDGSNFMMWKLDNINFDDVKYYSINIKEVANDAE